MNIQLALDFTPTPELLTARFWRRIQALENGCWEWTGTRNEKGYGLVQIRGGRNRRVHRVIYELLIGPIPTPLIPDHVCTNPWCANPLHLEPVTVAENTRRGYAARRRTAA